MSAPTPRHRRALALLATLAVALAACTSGGQSTDEPTGTGDATQLNAAVASFDMVVGQDQRLLLGLIGPDNQVVGGGEVEVRLAYGGGDQESTASSAPLSDPVTASFLPVPGDEPDVGDSPAFIEGSGAGVYEASVDLDRPGVWGMRASVELDGRTLRADTVFQVSDEPTVPAVGDPAPQTRNPTADSTDVAPAAIDSRAQGDDAQVPDPGLHDAVITDVLAAGRPMVVIVSTPVYCQSQFCGPITDTIQELSQQYGDRAEFVHLEVWREPLEQLNPSAAEWIADESGGGNEPWTFLVGADGTIRARWANVLDADELTAMLEELPAD